MKILSPVVVKAKAAGDDIGEARDDSAEEGVGRRLAGFRLATVFDVSQTEGRELPTLGVEELTGGVARYEAAMRAVSEVSRYPVSFEDVPGGAKGGLLEVRAQAHRDPEGHVPSADPQDRHPLFMSSRQ